MKIFVGCYFSEPIFFSKSISRPLTLNKRCYKQKNEGLNHKIEGMMVLKGKEILKTGE